MNPISKNEEQGTDRYQSSLPTENRNQYGPLIMYADKYRIPPAYSNQYKVPYVPVYHGQNNIPSVIPNNYNIKPEAQTQYNNSESNLYQKVNQNINQSVNQNGSQYVNQNGNKYGYQNGSQNVNQNGNQYNNQNVNQNRSQYVNQNGNQYSNQYGYQNGSQNVNQNGNQYSNLYGYQNGSQNENQNGNQYSNQYGYQNVNQNGNQYAGQQEYFGNYVAQPDFLGLKGMTPKSVVNRAGLALFILAMAVIAAQFIIEIPVMIFKPTLIETDWFVWALTALSMVGVGFPVYSLVMKGIPDSPRREVVKLKPSQFIKLFFICVTAMYITSILGSFLTMFIAALKGDNSLVNPAAEAIMNSNFFVTLAYAAVVAPIIEELIFRKMLLNKLRRFGDTPAILFTGIAFGLFHMNLSQMFYAAVLGFIFAYITIKTNTIRYSILLHIMINFIGTAVSPLAEDGNTIGSLLVSLWAICSIVIGVVLFFISKKKIKLEKSFPVLQKSDFILNVGSILYIGVCFVMIVLTTLVS